MQSPPQSDLRGAFSFPETPAMTQVADYTLILPAYREAENLRFLLPQIKQAAARAGGAWEIVVVDSKVKLDDTDQVCAEHGAVYVNGAPDDGYGNAVRTGIARATGRYIMFMDADGSHPPEFLEKMIAEAGKADIVIASRYMEGGHTENTWSQRAMSRVLNIVYALVLGLRVKDVSNGLKLYRAPMLKELELTCRNFDIVEEVLYKIVRLNPGLTMKEIPFTFKQRKFGESKRSLLAFILTYLTTIVRLRLMPVRRRSSP
jgi:dolichol-phosphate mannosyltransferase